MARRVARMRDRINAHRGSVGKPEGTPLERRRRSREDNIKIDRREVGWGARTGWMRLRIGTGGGLL